MKKTGKKWETKECPLCGEPHTNYSGKLKSDGTEYVVCGMMGKPINVPSPSFNQIVWK
jgi:hypothetical protein